MTIRKLLEEINEVRAAKGMPPVNAKAMYYIIRNKLQNNAHYEQFGEGTIDVLPAGEVFLKTYYNGLLINPTDDKTV